MASCSAIGILQSRSYKLRADGIKSFIDAFRIAKAEIVFKNTSVIDVYKSLEKQCTGMAKQFFGSVICGDGLADNADMVEKIDNCQLQDPEKSEIAGILSVMGRYDSTNQAEMMDKNILHLEQLYTQAQNDLIKNGKLSSAFGVTAGIVIAILLL